MQSGEKHRQHVKIITQCTAFHENLSMWVLQLLSFASSTRLRRRKRTWENFFYEYYTHILFLIGVNFYGDRHLHVSRC